MKKHQPALLFASIVAATTPAAYGASMVVDEATLPGGDFSDSWSTPTWLSHGTDGIAGELDSAAADYTDAVLFKGLVEGIHTFGFTFYTANGTPDNTLDIVFGYQTSSHTMYEYGLATAAGFSGTVDAYANASGDLRLEAFLEGAGGATTYSIELLSGPGYNPVDPEPPEVPLPGAAGLFAAGLGMLGAAKARRRARKRS